MVCHSVSPLKTLYKSTRLGDTHVFLIVCHMRVICVSPSNWMVIRTPIWSLLNAYMEYTHNVRPLTKWGLGPLHLKMAYSLEEQLKCYHRWTNFRKWEKEEKVYAMQRCRKCDLWRRIRIDIDLDSCSRKPRVIIEKTHTNEGPQESVNKSS